MYSSLCSAGWLLCENRTPCLEDRDVIVIIFQYLERSFLVRIFCLVTLKCLKWHPRFKLQSHGFVRAVVGVTWELWCCRPCWLHTMRGRREGPNWGPAWHTQEEKLLWESKTPLLSVGLDRHTLCRLTKELFSWLRPTECYFPVEVLFLLWNSGILGLISEGSGEREKHVSVHLVVREEGKSLSSFTPTIFTFHLYLPAPLSLQFQGKTFSCFQKHLPPISSIVGSPSTSNPCSYFIFHLFCIAASDSKCVGLHVLSSPPSS